MYFINVHSEYFMPLKLYFFIYVLSIRRIWVKIFHKLLFSNI